ncbi:uncharacterized protein FOMMEDRAFT_164171 [Fomitiporia mediterranea MF3/22]|uniref:Myb/SANT-like domain-containing protein n=1 Tax=Fomitiporia mediterranea (strain MF3/22) TaxID=694068 RepID=R7SEY8_FOMME|nr:uncharacterized protein FOMMEDRAFT_164171 [Fomitiporia mediterranea MF3/22]EJC97276.1 hypothetical protein FOMMEDRAFT_164171 [Fomitiporia mediterranea MF3/22]
MDDTKLVECLEYQKSIGNQSDSGFKSITWTYAASELNKVVVEGGEKTASGVKDHWQQVLKSGYVAIDWLLHKASGFGWDSTRHLVTADDDVWTRLIEAHPKYGIWQTRPFPLFNSIAELIGGRTANGRDSLDITEENDSETGETVLDGKLVNLLLFYIY